MDRGPGGGRAAGRGAPAPPAGATRRSSRAAAPRPPRPRSRPRRTPAPRCRPRAAGGPGRCRACCRVLSPGAVASRTGPDGRAPAATSSRPSASAAAITVSLRAPSASGGLGGGAGRSAGHTRHCTAGPTRCGTSARPAPPATTPRRPPSASAVRAAGPRSAPAAPGAGRASTHISLSRAAISGSASTRATAPSWSSPSRSSGSTTWWATSTPCTTATASATANGVLIIALSATVSRSAGSESIATPYVTPRPPGPTADDRFPPMAAVVDLAGVTIVRGGATLISDITWTVDESRPLGGHRTERRRQDHAAAGPRRPDPPDRPASPGCWARCSARSTCSSCGRGSA